MKPKKDIVSLLKKLAKRYKAPTPWAWRRFGDSLLLSCLFVTGSSIATKHDQIAVFFSLLGGIAKFITNFFAERK